jgi:hypothetical protein
MLKIFPLFVFVILIAIFTACSSTGNKDTARSKAQDSIEVTGLVRQAYEWHLKNIQVEFPFRYEKPADTIFTGIDWDLFHKNIEILRTTRFFTDESLENQAKIAATLDSSMKKATVKWRNINDGIPIWSSDADDWCNCQDYPENYWKTMKLDSLTIEGDLAGFYWTWDSKEFSESPKYRMTAKRVDDKWKINSMEGFDSYGSVRDYDKMMKE